jgi:hypothetical protein
VNVVGYVQKYNNFGLWWEGEIFEFLGEIVRLFPDWLKVVRVEDGQILRMDKGFDYKIVKEILG